MKLINPLKVRKNLFPAVLQFHSKCNEINTTSSDIIKCFQLQCTFLQNVMKLIYILQRYKSMFSMKSDINNIRILFRKSYKGFLIGYGLASIYRLVACFAFYFLLYT